MLHTRHWAIFTPRSSVVAAALMAFLSIFALSASAQGKATILRSQSGDIQVDVWQGSCRSLGGIRNVEIYSTYPAFFARGSQDLASAVKMTANVLLRECPDMHLMVVSGYVNGVRSHFAHIRRPFQVIAMDRIDAEGNLIRQNESADTGQKRYAQQEPDEAFAHFSPEVAYPLTYIYNGDFDAADAYAAQFGRRFGEAVAPGLVGELLGSVGGLYALARHRGVIA